MSNELAPPTCKSCRFLIMHTPAPPRFNGLPNVRCGALPERVSRSTDKPCSLYVNHDGEKEEMASMFNKRLNGIMREISGAARGPGDIQRRMDHIAGLARSVVFEWDDAPPPSTELDS